MTHPPRRMPALYSSAAKTSRSQKRQSLPSILHRISSAICNLHLSDLQQQLDAVQGELQQMAQQEKALIAQINSASQQQISKAQKSNTTRGPPAVAVPICCDAATSSFRKAPDVQSDLCPTDSGRVASRSLAASSRRHRRRSSSSYTGHLRAANYSSSDVSRRSRPAPSAPNDHQPRCRWGSYLSFPG